MKNLISMATIATLLVVAGCSETETDLPSVKGEKEGTALRVTTGVKTNTKAIVEGKAILYDDAEYATVAKGVGLALLNVAGDALYEAENADIYTDGMNVWFQGDAAGEKWKAISDLGASFGEATEKPYFLTENVAQVYAWYPCSSSATAVFEGTAADDLKVPVSLVTDDQTIDAKDINNATLMWDATLNENAGGWVSNTDNAKKMIAAAAEVDYLWFNPYEGRYVNNGRGTGEPTGINTDATNPGPAITISMEHALAMISFRVYNDGTFEGDGELKKIVLKNVGEGKILLTGAGAKMKLADGTISGFTDNGNTITRTVSNYTLPKQILTGTEDANSFIEDLEINPNISGKTVAKKVSVLVCPIAAIQNGELVAELTVGTNTYQAKIPAGVWTAGTNTVYTVRASRKTLEVTTVTVTEWYEEDGGDIEI